MKKITIPFLLGVLVSFYFFPVSFTFLPDSLNTKKMMAAIGIAVFCFNGIKRRSLLLFHKDVLGSAFFAALFSFACFVAVVVNGTNDMTYATYITSFFVWLSGAYFICEILKLRYGKLTMEIITKYLLWVCVAQCVSMLLIDNVPAFSALVDRIFSGNEFVKMKNRKYGIGCGLDPAGVRFTIVLVLAAFVGTRSVFPKRRFWKNAGWIFAFLFVSVFGNMISRTTIVGAGIGLAYMIMYMLTIRRGELSGDRLKTFSVLFFILIVSVPILIQLYNSSASMHSNLRFAFEGFFNWAETGVWSTSSTDKLSSVMWVWPTNTHDWIIGTGIIDTYAYSTDIGYCRFILYCGLVGFSIFSIFFIYNAIAVSKRFEGTGLLALMLLALTFIIWIKVSTDIFQIYAILFCLDAYGIEDLETDSEEEHALLDI